jgi:hypothetical protein
MGFFRRLFERSSSGMQLPRMVRIRQQFERERVTDVPAAVRSALAGLNLGRKIHPGQTVAITAGSRGIANIASILHETVRCLRELDAKPFLVPAMGSHGGGTVEGQLRVLEDLGITTESVGAPIRASMEVVTVGTTQEGYAVFLDREASRADHIGVVARVKQHTGYRGPIESGLLKMMMVGLGKHEGAQAYHRLLLDVSFAQLARSVAQTMHEHAHITFGLAMVDNAFDETARIEAVEPEDFEETEERLLLLARRWLGRLPFAQADLLIIDEIGKDISGTGMDTNVVGRKRATRNDQVEDGPRMRHIFVRRLTARTHGNATGIGRADFTTKRLVRSMDYVATAINCLTAGDTEGAALPIQFETDREAVEAALALIGNRSPERAHVMRIHTTLRLDELLVSEAAIREGKRATDFSVISPPSSMLFDNDGNLLPL